MRNLFNVSEFFSSVALTYLVIVFSIYQDYTRTYIFVIVNYRLDFSTFIHCCMPDFGMGVGELLVGM